MSNIQKFMIILIGLLFILFSISAVNSETFTNKNTTKEIQGFIDNKTDDKTLILDGEFNNLSTLNINRSMKISGKNAIIIKNKSSNSKILFNISVVNVTIENLVIRGYDTAIQSNKGNLIIQNNEIDSKIQIISTSNENVNNIIIKNNTMRSNENFSSGLLMESYSGNISNNRIYNNTIETKRINGVYLISTYGIFSNNNIYNNIIKTKANYSQGISIFSISGNIGIINNNIYGNIIETDGDDSIGIKLRSSGFLSNNNIFDNNIEIKGNYCPGIELVSIFGIVSNNSVFSNIIKTNGSSDYGVSLMSFTGTLDNNIYSNTIETNGVMSPGVTVVSNFGNVDNNRIYSNIIETNRNGADGISLLSQSGNISNNDIVGNNIMTNSIGIKIQARNINGLNVSYNRILANDSFIKLTTNGTDNLFFANWLGINNPDMDKILNITTISYYIMNAILINKTGFLGDNWTIDYRFILNGTNDTGEWEKLPDFNTTFSNENSEDLLSILAKKSTIINISIDEIVNNMKIDVKTDYQLLSLFVSSEEKPILIPPNPNSNPPKPVIPIEDDPLDPSGIDPTNNGKDDSNHKLEHYSSNSDSFNKSSISTSASMKKTGIPITLVILVLLAGLGTLIRRKQ